ncbi:MAG: hypothetical protein MUP44_04625 [Anaerolineales bacterium]|nr:hypothetical protein [Anaerolineales bacterium]
MMVFRRQPSFRRRNQFVAQQPLRRAALRQLRIAHRLLEECQWPRAAEQFESLATTAEKHAAPQAPQLFLLAGHARIEAGNQTVGLKHLRHAIQLFAEVGQIHRIDQIRPRIIAELRQRGLNREAAELDAMIHELLDRRTAAGTSQHPSSSSGHFPTKCPSCGGTLRPDELEWIDNLSGVCAYCGSMVAAD